MNSLNPPQSSVASHFELALPARQIHAAKPKLLNIQVIDSPTEWATLAEEWDRLVDDHPLHSYAWFSAWWKAFGAQAGRLAIACVRDRDQVVGLAPFFVTRSWLGNGVRFLGSGTTCTDYLDIFCASGYCEIVGEQLTGWLQSSEFGRRYGRLDLVELEGHRPSAPGVAGLASHLERGGWSSEIAALENCWVVPLTDAWDDYLTGLSARSRKRARTAMKHRASGQIEYQVWREPESIEQVWPKFIELHQKRRRDKGEAGCFHNQNFEKFIEQAVSQLAVDGRASLVGVLHGGQPIALGLVLHGSNCNFLYQTGMDGNYIKLEPGHLLNALTLQECWLSGIRRFDFLRGDEPYKARWAAHPEPLVRTRFWSYHMVARVRANLVRAGKMLKQWTGKPQFNPPQESGD